MPTSPFDFLIIAESFFGMRMKYTGVWPEDWEEFPTKIQNRLGFPHED